MQIGKLSRTTPITRTFILAYARAGFGKTTSLINLNWEEVLYISTETGFRVLKGLLDEIEKYDRIARLTNIDEAIENLKKDKPKESEQVIEMYIESIRERNTKPENYILEIDHVHVTEMNDLFSDAIWKVYQDKGNLQNIDMSKKNIIILDTLTYYSDLVVKERKEANKNNSNRFATWAEHSDAIKRLLDRMASLRGIKVVFGHECYDKDLKEKTLALQGDAVKTDIPGRFNVVLYGTEIKENEDVQPKRYWITNPDVISDKVVAKTQLPQINGIEEMDLNKIINKIKGA